jgi:diguanylate cyclase (GGDEF)-like protein
MPVWIAGHVGGFIGLDNTQEAKPWHTEDVSLLRVSSNLIGSALTREKYEIAEQEARRQSEVLRQAMVALTTDLELDQVLEKLLVYLEQVIAYDSASVILFEKDFLWVKSARGILDVDQVIGQSFPADNALFQEMCRKKQPLILTDAQVDPGFEEWGVSDYIRGWMGIPLIGREGILGYLTVDSRQTGAYGKEAARLAKTFAAQAAITIENARLYAELQVAATSDPLTGLHNRRHFFVLAAQELSRARRHDRPLSAIMLDIDQFKRVNDTYGHAVGDSVLEEAAAVMGAEIRNNDVIARYGGEEFVILLPETDLSIAQEVAERVRKKIAQTDFLSGNGPVHITASLGVATLQPDWYSIDPLLQFADSALYMAKAKGRNRVEMWGAH